MYFIRQINKTMGFYTYITDMNILIHPGSIQFNLSDGRLTETSELLPVNPQASTTKRIRNKKKKTGVSEGEYSKLKVKFSAWYDKRRHEGLFNRLKCTCIDLLDNATFSNNKEKRTIVLLNALHDAGKLSRNNLIILHDTITTTDQDGLRGELGNLLPSFSNAEVSSFTQHRQRVLKFFSTLSDEDVHKINGLFNYPTKPYSDRWDMLFDLEKCRGKIDEDNFDEIIEELKESGLKAPASKSSTRGKATLTSVESDEEENSGYSDDSNEVYTPKMKGKRALTSKGTRKRKMADNSEESDEGENAAPASKSSKRGKATLTSVEYDEEENSGYSDDSNEVYTPKMKGKRALTSKGTRKRKMADNSEESDEGENAENKNNKQPEKLETKQKNQIMISYSQKQRGTVGLIVNSLKKRLEDSHTIWIDKRKMFGRMSTTLDKAICDSSIVLLCTSKAYEESEYCKFECDKVLEYDKKLIPLKMESYKPKKDSQIQQVIAGRFYIDFSKTIRYEENINTLIRNIEELEKDQM
ncbi:uncharacterized protein [Antedon mediterranea]|uniref:uncharacterized protein n=1 Tax=Antedon mediterranea TaxID=105859 RepID=UPI003AF58A4A